MIRISHTGCKDCCPVCHISEIIGLAGYFSCYLCTGNSFCLLVACILYNRIVYESQFPSKAPVISFLSAPAVLNFFLKPECTVTVLYSTARSYRCLSLIPPNLALITVCLYSRLCVYTVSSSRIESKCVFPYIIITCRY